MLKMDPRLTSQRCNAKKEKRKTQFTKIAAPRPLAVIALKNSSGAAAAAAAASGGLLTMTSPRMPEERDWEEAMESFISERRGAVDSDDDEGGSFSFSSDLEAESELQQIFGCCGFQATASGLESLLLSSAPAGNRGGSGSMFDIERPSSPFAMAQTEAAADFPRLGMSPALLDEDYTYEYPVPSRAHNPLTLNTPFGRRSQELIEQQLSLYNQQQQEQRYSQQLYYNNATQQHSQFEFNLGFLASADDDDDTISLHAHSYPSHRATRSRSYSEPIQPQFVIDC